MSTENQIGGVSRRDLLKKGAVAGGIVWAAPLVLSSPAGASYVGSDSECTHFYYGKFDTNETAETITPGTCQGSTNGSTCYAPGGAGYVENRTYGSACATVIAVSGRTLTLSKYLNNDPTQPEIRAVEGFTKGGTVCGDAGASGVTQNSSDGTWTITFPRRSPGGGFSHVEFAFCVTMPG